MESNFGGGGQGFQNYQPQNQHFGGNNMPNQGGGYQGNQSKFHKDGKPKKPLCRFFFTPQGCTKGNACTFHHPKNKQKYDPSNQNQQQQSQGGFGNQGGHGGPHGGGNFSQPITKMPYLSGPKKSKVECRYGAACKKKDSCTFRHPDDGGMQEDLGAMGGQHQDQSFGAGRVQIVGGSGQGCHKFAAGSCEMVRCKYAHFLPGSNVSFKFDGEINVTGGRSVYSGALVNNKTQVIVVTDDENAYLHNVADSSIQGPLKLPGKPTCLRTFDSFQNTFFIGLETKTPVGLCSYTFLIMLSDYQIIQENAHQDRITDVECTNQNGQLYFFTSSLDKSVKAWTLSEDQRSLKQVVQTPLAGPALSMQLVNPDFLVIGLDNGCYTGWTLSANKQDQIEAHKSGAVTTLHKYQDFILSGDRSGNVQIRSISNQYNLMAPEFQINNPKPITCFFILQAKGEHLILAGDSNGMINVMKIEQNGQINQSQFGAFKDDKNHKYRVVNIYSLDDTGSSIFAIGENGSIRKWSIQ
eukprot:403346504